MSDRPQIIYKYTMHPVEARSEDSIVIKHMPTNAEFLHLGVQHNTIALWYRLDAQNHEPIEPRPFRIVGTGDPRVRPQDKYLGTAMLDVYVFHVFEVPEYETTK